MLAKCIQSKKEVLIASDADIIVIEDFTSIIHELRTSLALMTYVSLRLLGCPQEIP